MLEGYDSVAEIGAGDAITQLLMNDAQEEQAAVEGGADGEEELEEEEGEDGEPIEIEEVTEDAPVIEEGNSENA